MQENQEQDKVLEHMRAVDLPWDERAPELWRQVVHREMEQFRPTIGTSEGGALLDCSCGIGNQAIALAKLGWQVTATGLGEASLAVARQRARLDGIRIDWDLCDMRALGQRFDAQFEWIVTCFALYALADDADIQRVVEGMVAALKPGGRCYIRLSDMDALLEEKPRHMFDDAICTLHRRAFSVKDWRYRSETHIPQSYVSLTEDEQYDDWHRWCTYAAGTRERVIHQSELAHFLVRAGFVEITFLERTGYWEPYEVVARKKETQ
jgi:ubiquinone/menaquinone biosynthesis C-methylase UbiE